MKKAAILATIVLVSSNSPLVSAIDDNASYAGAFYSYQELDGQEQEVGGIMAGYRFSETLAAEARLGWGATGYSSGYESPEYRGQDYKEDIKNQGSLLLKGSYPFSKATEVYVLGGVSRTRLTIHVWGENRYPDGSVFGRFYGPLNIGSYGFTYGLGVNHQLSTNVSLFLDYQVFLGIDADLPDKFVLPASENRSESEMSLWGFKLGAVYHF